jgi:transcription antitermination factor NusG
MSEASRADHYNGESRWWAVYTHSRHEKLANRYLHNTGTEVFLPLYKASRRWNQRSARVELPLFPCYLFVRIPLSERMRVLKAPGVIRIVGTGEQLTPLDDHEVSGIRSYLESDLPAEPFEAPAVGERVRILSGPLSGFTGTLLRQKGRARAVIEIELLMRSIIVDVDHCDLAPLRTGSGPGVTATPPWCAARK